ncbi:MAG: hypothetical protein OXF99_08315 [bacterium]|nr:hypothetical protein [bacterium]
MAIALVSAVVGAICSFAGAQSEVPVRIVARRATTGGTEVALQLYEGGDHWGDLVLPVERFFSDDDEIRLWRYSSPVAVQTLAGEQWVRIATRRVAAGGTEVALQQVGEGYSWGVGSYPPAGSCLTTWGSDAGARARRSRSRPRQFGRCPLMPVIPPQTLRKASRGR